MTASPRQVTRLQRWRGCMCVICNGVCVCVYSICVSLQAELVMEALELYRSEIRKICLQLNRLTMSWHVMKKAHSSEPEVSLLVLPFPYVPNLLSLFNSYVQDGLEVELVCRFFLLRVHFGQISSNQMLPMIHKSYQTVSRLLLLDVLGFNSRKEDIMFFVDAASMRSKREKRALLIIA
uniref:Small-subunit processome Utp12 domain-containing protein n=1 Tax=Oncorhynchus kisutch TaxID=8019 RepID=A0A8C7CEN5_ONCKI